MMDGSFSLQKHTLPLSPLRSNYFSPGPCYYAGDAEGGRSGQSDDDGSVIEGKYTDYQVAGLFSHEYVYSQFEEGKCRV